MNRCGFLHHLDRYPAGENNNPLLRGGILADEGTCELIERVVAPDILPHSHEPPGRVPKARCVHRASLMIQGLSRKEGVDRCHDLIRSEHETLVHRGRWPHCFDQTLDAAEPTTCRSRHLAPAPQKLCGMRRL